MNKNYKNNDKSFKGNLFSFKIKVNYVQGSKSKFMVIPLSSSEGRFRLTENESSSDGDTPITNNETTQLLVALMCLYGYFPLRFNLHDGGTRMS